MKKMKKSDILVVALLYAVCAWWSMLNLKINPESRTYPWFCISLLSALTTLYAAKMIYDAVKYGTENDFGVVFKGFIPKQFFAVLAAIIVYYFLITLIGFYPSTLIFMIFVLWFLKVSLKASAIATLFLLLLIYLAFTEFLGVKLPAGMIFG